MAVAWPNCCIEHKTMPAATTRNDADDQVGLSVAASGNFIWGSSPGALGPRDEAPVGDLGTKYTLEAEAVCRHCLQMLSAQTIKI